MSASSVEEIHAVRQKFPAVIEKAPIDIRRQVPTFGVKGAELRLMKEMKRALDPQGRLNPGRHIDGE